MSPVWTAGGECALPDQKDTEEQDDSGEIEIQARESRGAKGEGDKGARGTRETRRHCGLAVFVLSH